jgi:hypothetical protein
MSDRQSLLKPVRSRARAAVTCPRGRKARFAAALVASCLSIVACTPTRFETTADVPAPLIDKIPITIGVHLPLEFREKVYEEKRQGSGEYKIGLGKAQATGFMRILDAMFAKVVTVNAPAEAATVDPSIRGVLEPVLEEYAFVTPIDSGTPAYAASLRYTIKLYSPKGELSDSWTFTGYGSQPASSFPGKGDEALQAATRLAMRDAAAKLAAEFREQAIARGLIGGNSGTAPSEVPMPAAPPPQQR